MSSITDVILVCSEIGQVEFRRRLDQVNAFGVNLTSVEDPRLPPDWYCGPKRLESCIAVGACNHLDVPAFLDHLRTNVAWDREFDEFCQVILRGPEDSGFELHEVFRVG